MNATTHPVAPEELMAFLDGELSADRVQFISTHIETCAECGDVAKSLRITSKALSQWQTNTPRGALDERVIEIVTNAQSPDSASPNWIRRFQHFFSRPFPWALACLGMVVLIGARLFEVAPAPLSSRSKTGEHRSVLLTNPPESAGNYDAFEGKAAGGGGGGARLRSPVEAGGRFSNAIPGSAITDRLPLSDSAKIPQAVLAGPMIARTVSLSIIVKDFDAGRASLDAILMRHNGYAASLNVSTPQGAARTLQASLRIPAPRLVSALAELKALGRVEAETQNGEEVTQQHADLVARLKNSRETEQRLQDVLRTRTGKVKDVLEVEEEIARVRGEIEQMEAEQKTLEHRVDFATIDLKLAEEYKAQLSSPAPSVAFQLHNATVNGFRNAFESLLGMVLFLAESGPTLLLWLSILAVPGWMLWRRYRRAQSLGSLAGV